MPPQATVTRTAGRHQKLGGGEGGWMMPGMGPPTELPGRHLLDNTLILNFWPPELSKKKILCFKPPRPGLLRDFTRADTVE